MKQSRICRRLLLKYLNAPFANPTPNFSSEQCEKHHKKPSADFATKDGHCEACLGDGEPRLFIELFDLDGAEGAVEELLQEEEEGAYGDEDEVCEDLLR